MRSKFTVDCGAAILYHEYKCFSVCLLGCSHDGLSWPCELTGAKRTHPVAAIRENAAFLAGKTTGALTNRRYRQGMDSRGRVKR